jgi:3-dehydroquinate dehydratase
MSTEDSLNFSQLTPNRLLDALKAVSLDVARDVINKARLTHTPVILADAQGNILTLDPEELAKQYGLD